MKSSVSCFTPLDMQRREVASYLRRLCTSRAVDMALAEQVIAALDGLDAGAFDAIQRSTLERFPEPCRDNSYLNVCAHVAKAMRLYLLFIEKNKRNRKVVKESKPHRKILDIGSGSAAFSFLCNALGHRATGLERPRAQEGDQSLPLKYSLADWYNIHVIEHEIEAGVPFPIADRSFDHFVMFYPTFYREWTEQDWDRLFSDLTRCASKDDSKLYVRTNTPKLKDEGVVHFSYEEFVLAVEKLSHHLVEKRSYVIDLK